MAGQRVGELVFSADEYSAAGGSPLIKGGTKGDEMVSVASAEVLTAYNHPGGWSGGGGGYKPAIVPQGDHRFLVPNLERSEFYVIHPGGYFPPLSPVPPFGGEGGMVSFCIVGRYPSWWICGL